MVYGFACVGIKRFRSTSHYIRHFKLDLPNARTKRNDPMNFERRPSYEVDCRVIGDSLYIEYLKSYGP